MNDIAAILSPILSLIAQLAPIGIQALTAKSEDSATILASVQDAIATYTATVNGLPGAIQANDAAIDAQLKAEAEKPA